MVGGGPGQGREGAVGGRRWSGLMRAKPGEGDARKACIACLAATTRALLPSPRRAPRARPAPLRRARTSSVACRSSCWWTWRRRARGASTSSSWSSCARAWWRAAWSSPPSERCWCSSTSSKTPTATSRCAARGLGHSRGGLAAGVGAPFDFCSDLRSRPFRSVRASPFQWSGADLRAAHQPAARGGGGVPPGGLQGAAGRQRALPGRGQPARGPAGAGDHVRQQDLPAGGREILACKRGRRAGKRQGNAHGTHVALGPAFPSSPHLPLLPPGARAHHAAAAHPVLRPARRVQELWAGARRHEA
jgi:hypothetical protein